MATNVIPNVYQNHALQPDHKPDPNYEQSIDLNQQLKGLY